MLKHYSFFLITVAAIFLIIVFLALFIFHSLENKMAIDLRNKSKGIITATQSYDYRTYPKSYLDSLEKVKDSISDSYYKTFKPSDKSVAAKVADIKKSKARVIATVLKGGEYKKKGSTYIITLSVDLKKEVIGPDNKPDRSESTEKFIVTWKKEGKDYKITSIKETWQ